MPTIGWIDALRTYNAGMPSWCVPRKGTPGYERVMRIRQGEQTKGFKEVLEDLERKTSGKPKKDKKSMAIDLGTQSANVPTIPDESPKTEVSTQKSSGSNNKKKMAVVPVNYVAEGGAEKVAKGGSKSADEVRRSQLIKERDELRHDMSARSRRGRLPNAEADYKNERKLADLTNEIRAIDRRMKKEAKEGKESAKEVAEEGGLPPIMSGPAGGAENDDYLAVLRDYKEKGVLYMRSDVGLPGTAELDTLHVRQGKTFRKIAVVRLDRPKTSGNSHQVYFYPNKHASVVSVALGKQNGILQFGKKI